MSRDTPEKMGYFTKATVAGRGAEEPQQKQKGQAKRARRQGGPASGENVLEQKRTQATELLSTRRAGPVSTHPTPGPARGSPRSARCGIAGATSQRKQLNARVRKTQRLTSPIKYILSAVVPARRPHPLPPDRGLALPSQGQRGRRPACALLRRSRGTWQEPWQGTSSGRALQHK